jgi:hypothetical protein
MILGTKTKLKPLGLHFDMLLNGKGPVKLRKSRFRKSLRKLNSCKQKATQESKVRMSSSPHRRLWKPGSPSGSNDAGRDVGQATVSYVQHHEGTPELRAQLVRDCQDDEDKYHNAFQQLFVPFIGATTAKDLQRAEAFDKKFDEHRGHAYMRQRCIDTALTKEAAEQLKNVTLPDGVSWKDVVHALHSMERSMYHHLGKSGDNLTLAPEATEPSRVMKCFVVDAEAIDERGLHLLGCFHTMPMVSHDYPGYFEVDVYEHAVTLRVMETAHHVEEMYHALGLPSPNTGTESYHFDFATRRPSTGSFICLVEGLCAWNRKEERYELVYPISALRSLYGWCEQQLEASKKKSKR